ncbi:hypothetical protein E3U44_15510 [Nitrosococcus wardiae]|uniref:Uncharacterized protein n=1 Tax=Nitrosococcus wardiae TaxID=1814290 RepID=A0A4P7C4H7_9GAMM|nr:hypothetical protein E3U44_15510 [Nitrosococcus wardiae]
MTGLIEIFFARTALIKAELQQSKVRLFYFIAALILFLLGILFFAGACVLILISIGLALNNVLPLPVVLLITGIIAILFGIILIFMGNVKIR